MAARVWGQATAKRMDKPFPDCALCRRPGPEGKAKRERWGCDRPAARVVFTSGCSACMGSSDSANPCTECEGGVIEHKRCPTALLGAAAPRMLAQVGRAFSAYLVFEGHNALPAAGGWLDQTVSFHQVCAVVDNERGRYNRIQDEHDAAKRNQAQAARANQPSTPRRGR